MTEYSDEQACENDTLVKGWFEEFSETSFFEELSVSQKENAGFIIEILTDYMYSYEGETPKEWSDKSIFLVCTDIFPRKISADEGCFQSIEPVLTNFFNFLASKKYLPQATKLASKVKNLTKMIVSASNDSRNWGIAKSFMMGANGAGSDFFNSQSNSIIDIMDRLKSSGNPISKEKRKKAKAKLKMVKASKRKNR